MLVMVQWSAMITAPNVPTYLTIVESNRFRFESLVFCTFFFIVLQSQRITRMIYKIGLR